MRQSEERLTPQEFARRLGKGLNHVRKLIKAGRISVEDVRSPGSSLPRYQIPASEISRYRASCRMRGLPQELKKKRRPSLRNVPEVIR